jgi:type IV pilus assembly protein PilA
MKKNGGFTLIELMIVIAIIAIIAAIAIPNLIEARKGSNEAAAIGALRTITTAESLFREGDKDKNGVFDYGALLALNTSGGLIDSVLGSGTKQGYLFTVTIPGTAPDNQYSWEAGATPIVVGKTGDRYFFVNESGVIRYSTSGAATSASPPIGG